MSTDSHASVLLVYGNQDYLVKQSALQHQQHVLKDVPIDFGWQRFDAYTLLKEQGDEEASAQLDVACATQPFGCARYLVQVDGVEILKQKSAGQLILNTLLKWIKDPAEGLYILLTAIVEKENELSTSLLKSVQELSHHKQAGAIHSHITHNNWNPSSWLQEEAQKRHLFLAPNAAALLIDMAGNQLTTLSKVLDKLVLITDEEITDQHILSVVQAGKTPSVFQIVDYLTQKNLHKTLPALQFFWRQSPRSYPMLLGALGRHFRQLLQLHAWRSQNAKGKSSSPLNLPPFVLRQLEKKLQHFTPLELARSIEAVATLDRLFKISSKSLWPCTLAFTENLCNDKFKENEFFTHQFTEFALL